MLGLANRTKLRDRSRSMRRRAHDIGAWLRRRTDVAKEEAKAITAEMATIAEASLTEAKRVAANARRGLRNAGDAASGRARAKLADLELVIGRLDRVVAQTRGRLEGEMPGGSARLVSLHDPDARPIKKGRIGKPVEFGYLAQVLDNEDGVVVDHGVRIGNPPDGPLLVPAIGRVKALTGRAPRAVTADRGYGEAKVDTDLSSLGVRFVAIVRKGRQSAARQAAERRPRFRKLVKWRTGSEGSDLGPEAQLGLVPQLDGRPRRHRGLVRLRGFRAQQPEDQRSHRRQRADDGPTAPIESRRTATATGHRPGPSLLRRCHYRLSPSLGPSSRAKPAGKGPK